MWTLGFLSCMVLATADAQLPPKITHQPVPEHIFRLGAKDLEMVCEAEGVPEVEYSWKKNNLDFERNSENINVDFNSGTFTFKEVYNSDAGYYQCFARNQYGRAMSQVSSVQRAVLGNFPTQSEPKEVQVNQGDKLLLQCYAPESFPPPMYQWVIIDDMQDQSPSPLTQSKRRMWDLDGHLHFMNVELGDHLGGRIYRCQVYNSILNTTKGGSEHRIIVNTMTPASTKPQLEYGPAQSVIVLAGTDMMVQCIFSGFPTPNFWFRRKGGSMPYNRFKTAKYSTVMIIEDVQESDEGAYICSGENSQGKTEFEFTVDVQVKPVFESQSDRPHDINKTEGESVIFLCNAKSVPIAEVQWFKNGERIHSASPGPRMSVTDQGQKLTIVDLCKTCSGGGTDLMVIQCNASNVHGYAFAEGYLNVLSANPASSTTIKDEDLDPCKNCSGGDAGPMGNHCNAGVPVSLFAGVAGALFLALVVIIICYCRLKRKRPAKEKEVALKLAMYNPQENEDHYEQLGRNSIPTEAASYERLVQVTTEKN